MRLLDRYLLRELLVPLAVCLGGFLMFWISFNLFSELNRLQELKLSVGDILTYELVRTPEFLASIVLPVTLLLALLYVLSQHAKHHELTAIRAAGVSTWRMALPYLMVGLLASFVSFALSEFVAPWGSNRAEQIVTHEVTSKADAENHFEKLFFATRDSRWALDYNVFSRTMRDVHIDWEQADQSRLVFVAARGVRSNGVWVFYDVQAHTEVATNPFPINRIATNVLAMPQFTVTPEQIKNLIAIRRESRKAHVERTTYTLKDLRDYLRLNPDLPRADRLWAETQIQGRFAAPWTCLVVVLIAIPFGAASGRRNVFKGVAGSILIGFAYFVLMQVGLALGASGRMPPWLGAWLPNLFFSLLGTVLTFRVR